MAVVTTTHELLTLGDNSHGQLGLGDLRARTTPQRVATQVLQVRVCVCVCACVRVCAYRSTYTQQVDAGHSHTLFMTLNGSLFSSGSNSCGQLGQPPERSIVMDPELVQTVSGAVCLFACGDHHSVVVTDANVRAVQAFGSNDHGQLGIGARCPAVFEASAVDLEDQRPLAVAAGRYHSLFVGHRGAVYACGRNASGQLGLESRESVSKPVRVRLIDELLRGDQGSDSVRAVSCGAFHSLALTRRGKVISWGANTFGQLGIGLVGSEGNCDSKGAGGGSWYEPSFVEIDVWRQPLDEVVGVACGAEHSLLLSVSGQVYGSGCNAYGQLGHILETPSTNSASTRGGEGRGGTHIHYVSCSRPPAHKSSATATACAVLPRRLEQGAARIRAIFGGGDMTVCLPVTGATVEELRSRELQRQLHASLGYVDLLKAAADAALRAAADSEMAARRARVRGSKDAIAQVRLQSSLECQTKEVTAILGDVTHVVAGYTALVDKVEALKREMVEESARALQMAEESARALQLAADNERAAEQRHRQELHKALAEKAAMEEELRRLQQQKLSTLGEEKSLQQQKLSTAESLGREGGEEEVVGGIGVHRTTRTRSAAAGTVEEEESEADEATPSPTPTPSSDPPTPTPSLHPNPPTRSLSTHSTPTPPPSPTPEIKNIVEEEAVAAANRTEAGVAAQAIQKEEAGVAAQAIQKEEAEAQAKMLSPPPPPPLPSNKTNTKEEEEAAKKEEEEAANRKREEDAAAAKQKDEEAAAAAKKEEEAAAKKKEEMDAAAAKKKTEEDAARTKEEDAAAGSCIVDVVSWMVGQVEVRAQAETVGDTLGEDAGVGEWGKVIEDLVSWMVGEVEAHGKPETVQKLPASKPVVDGKGETDRPPFQTTPPHTHVTTPENAPREEDPGRKGRIKGHATAAEEEEEEEAADATDSDDDESAAGGAGGGGGGGLETAARARKAGLQETETAEDMEEGGSDVPDSDDENADSKDGEEGNEKGREGEMEGGRGRGGKGRGVREAEKTREAGTTRGRQAASREVAEEEAEEGAADASDSDGDRE